ncbi:hypothetical protein K435DRAFT_838584 [Dendrothele bispora CBS 962.96]|uniref:Uncharacterized protein n=1 Tax=Dendrothele bispora (strain CBS 962.96) TaxID=1314807 RepID=A0A4S8M5J3_DENBC|nr:hypothetical protein K435DRAFT_838584 [Dendrothele bispora CBS 962.96]
MAAQENLLKPSLHSQFTKETSGQYYDFWYHTWGHGQDKQKVDQVLIGLPADKNYKCLKLLPSREEPAITSVLQGILIFSEYERFLHDLEDMLNGTADDFPTEVRSDPSSWDSWNEMERMEWKEYSFWDEEGLKMVSEGQADLGAVAPAEDSIIVIPQVVQVIGQPGIGKSLLLYFILAKRLLQSKATFLHSAPGVAFYFCSDGVYRFKPPMSTDQWQYELTEKDVMLFDSGRELPTPEGHWVHTPIRIIESASPRQNRLDWISKLPTPHYRWFMRPMSSKEFLLAATLQKSPPNPEMLRMFYRDFGPNAREAYLACINDRKYAQYTEMVKSKIKSISSDQLRNTFYSADGLHYDNNITHSVFLVTAGPRRYEHRTGFVSRHIYKLILTQYSGDQRGHIIDLFSVFHREVNTRASAGYLFEDFMHQILEKGASLEMQIMSDTKTGRGKNVIFRPDPNKPTEFLELAFSVTAQLYSGDEKVLRPGLYCKPAIPNAATFDSYYWNQAKGIIWLFQFTVSERHDVKEEGTKWIMDRAQQQTINAKINHVAFSPSNNLRLAIPKNPAPHLTSGSSRTFDGVYHVYMHDFVDRAKASASVRCFSLALANS